MSLPTVNQILNSLNPSSDQCFIFLLVCFLRKELKTHINLKQTWRFCFVPSPSLLAPTLLKFILYHYTLLPPLHLISHHLVFIIENNLKNKIKIY